jgi:hypothetical protein
MLDSTSAFRQRQYTLSRIARTYPCFQAVFLRRFACKLRYAADSLRPDILRSVCTLSDGLQLFRSPGK